MPLIPCAAGNTLADGPSADWGRSYKAVVMGGKTVTRADLAEAVYRRLGLSRTESAHMVEMVLQEICDAIVRGENVKLSSFGSFLVRQKGERVGRNPRTGHEVPIPPRRVTVFKPSNIMKERINASVVEGQESPRQAARGR